MGRILINSDHRPDGSWVIAPTGKVDVFTYGDLKKCLDELAGANPAVMAVVDLHGVDYVGSSGWSVLLSRRSSFRRQGGDLSICGMSDKLKRVYDTMKIDDMLPASASVDDAIKQFRSGQQA